MSFHQRFWQGQSTETSVNEVGLAAFWETPGQVVNYGNHTSIAEFVSSRPGTVALLFHEFKFTWFPGFFEPWLQWAIDAQ